MKKIIKKYIKYFSITIGILIIVFVLFVLLVISIFSPGYPPNDVRYEHENYKNKK